MEYLFGYTRKMWQRYWLQLVGGVGVLIILAGAIVGLSRSNAQAVRFVTAGDWSSYLSGNGRSGYNSAETLINPTSAPNLKKKWALKAAGKISSQPISVNGLIYWGSWDGVEHATNPATGTDTWTQALGQAVRNCRGWSLGVLSTATFGSLTINKISTPVLFIGGDDAQVYALNASTGAVIWHTAVGVPPNDFLYSSPALYNGNVYIGVSGSDCGYTQGRLVQLSASTGVVQHTFYAVPGGCIGGSIWSSPAIDTTTGMLYLSTGEKKVAGSCTNSTPMPYTMALVELNATDLSYIGSWQIPKANQVSDGDFGSTPTLFRATISGVSHQMVGLENKDGFYFAFDRTNITAGPLWQSQVAIPGPSTGIGDSISSSAWDGTTLYVSSAQTLTSDKTCPSTSGTGTLKALNPTNGSVIWEFCLPVDAKDPVTASPGVVVVGSGNSLFVVNAATGKQLFTFQDGRTQSNFWAPAMISNGMLYEGNQDGYMYAFCVPGSNGC